MTRQKGTKAERPERSSALSFVIGHLSLVIGVALIALLPGCASAPAPQAQIAPWDSHYPQSRCVVTPHYRIYTDISDNEDLQNIAVVMESAYARYQRAFPVAPGNVPLRCYVFARRDEWAAFTATNAGQDAGVYLAINRGAYTLDDWFAAFWIGDLGTYSVMAHEGWHQYLARYFSGRLPPALEEGFACQFENLDFTNHTPAWHPSRSVSRVRALADALAEKRLWPIRSVLKMHAGDIVKLSRPQIETFYAENWALSLFLMEHYPSEMKRFFAEAATGTAWRPAAFSALKPSEWNPNLSGPQLEHYLGKPIASLEGPFLNYCRNRAMESRDE